MQRDGGDCINICNCFDVVENWEDPTTEIFQYQELITKFGLKIESL